MCVCVCVCVWEREREGEGEWERVHTCVCLCVCTYLGVCVCTYILICVWCIHMFMYICVCVYHVEAQKVCWHLPVVVHVVAVAVCMHPRLCCRRCIVGILGYWVASCLRTCTSVQLLCMCDSFLNILSVIFLHLFIFLCYDVFMEAGIIRFKKQENWSY